MSGVNLETRRQSSTYTCLTAHRPTSLGYMVRGPSISFGCSNPLKHKVLMHLMMPTCKVPAKTLNMQRTVLQCLISQVEKFGSVLHDFEGEVSHS